MKELRLRGVTSIDGANEVLRGGFVDHLNQKFAIPPAGKEDGHRPVPAGVKLAEVFSFEEERSVVNDWVVRYYNRFFQISKDNPVLPKPKDRVTVRVLLDGRLQLVYAGQALRYKEVPADQGPTVTKPPKATPQPVPVRAVSTPGPMHPWRQSKLFPRGRVIGASTP